MSDLKRMAENGYGHWLRRRMKQQIEKIEVVEYGLKDLRDFERYKKELAEIDEKYSHLEPERNNKEETL